MDRKSYIRLPLKNTYNVRDLGGYPCSDGKITNSNTFLRGDSLANIDSRDIDFLLDYGLTGVVDLRSVKEIQRRPNPLVGIKGVSYTNVQLMVGEVDDASQAGTADPDRVIPEFYLGLLRRSQDKICETFNVFAEQKGCTLFHCSAGKDRTGVIAMLLLGLAGVSRSDVVANYQVTYTYIKESPMAKESIRRFPPQTMYSQPEYIEESVDYLTEQFGGVEQYLNEIGVSDQTAKNVRDRLKG